MFDLLGLSDRVHIDVFKLLVLLLTEDIANMWSNNIETHDSVKLMGAIFLGSKISCGVSDHQWCYRAMFLYIFIYKVEMHHQKVSPYM